MPIQKISSFIPQPVIILMATFMLSLFPLQSESGEIYTYTDEKGVTVITNTPLPDKIGNKAKKIESYKDAKDKTVIQPNTDVKGKPETDADKKKAKAGNKVQTDAELFDKMKKSDAETDRFIKSVNESKNKAADVLTTLKQLSH